MNNLSDDRHQSTDNILIDNPSIDSQNFVNIIYNLGRWSQRHHFNYNINDFNNENETSLSRTNLLSQRKWKKIHPFELITGNAEK